MSDNWNDIAEWWAGEATSDPAYPFVVHPMLEDLTEGMSGRLLDLGCGEGQGMRLIGGDIIGIDLSEKLVAKASQAGSAIVAELPDLAFIRDQTVDGAYSVYLLDLIDDHTAFFRACARVVRPGGHLVVVMNHPAYTAPGAAPFLDADGEVLWRWGAYFEAGSALEHVGPRNVRFFHRPIGHLVSAAADAGWCLERLEERGLSSEVIERLPGYEGQEGIPRLIGVRWRRL